MNARMTPDPVSAEGPLLTLFEEIEPPAGLEARWQSRIALLPADETDWEAGATRQLPVEPRRRRAVGPWVRVAAVGVGVTTAAAIVVGVVAANRVPPTVPEPDPSITITNPPHPTSPPPPSVTAPPPSDAVPNAPPGQPGTGQPGTGPPGRKTPNNQPPAANPPDPTVPPARGPLTEWPDEANTGVPPGTGPRPHRGDLHVDTAGAVVHDLWIEGTVHVEAPNVTLRRVHVAPPSGAAAGIRQLPQAPGLTIEDSEIFGASINVQVGIRQEAPELTVRRSITQRTDTSVVITGPATLVDNRLGTVLTNGNTTGLAMRHNTIDIITMSDENGPITEVSIENNRLGIGIGVVIWAPSRPGSRHIRIVDNHFNRGDPTPCNGWNDQAPGNTWSGNVWIGTSEPVDPHG